MPRPARRHLALAALAALLLFPLWTWPRGPYGSGGPAAPDRGAGGQTGARRGERAADSGPAVELTAPLRQGPAARVAADAAAEPGVEPAPATARLVVRLRDDGGRPVAGAALAVRPFDGGPAVLAREVRDGDYAAQLVRAARCEVRVEGLPSGLLPPRAQRARHGRTTVDVPQGETELTLEVVRAARVFGRVLDPRGRPLPGTHARFDEVHGAASRADLGSCYASAYGTGTYERWLDPGEWLCTAQPHGPPDGPPPPPGSARPPVPEGEGWAARLSVVRLAPGEARELDLGWELGAGSLAVVVRDERGAPFAGARVHLCRASVRDAVTGASLELGLGSAVARAVTDAEGRAGFAGLTAGDHSVVVEPEGYAPLAPPGHAVLGRRPAPRRVTIDQGHAHLELVARRARPVRIEGRIERRGPDATAAVVLQVVLAAGAERARDRVEEVRVAADGTFGLWVDRSEGGVELVVATAATTEAVALSWDPEGELAAPIPVSIVLPPRGGKESR